MEKYTDKQYLKEPVLHLSIINFFSFQFITRIISSNFHSRFNDNTKTAITSHVGYIPVMADSFSANIKYGDFTASGSEISVLLIGPRLGYQARASG